MYSTWNKKMDRRVHLTGIQYAAGGRILEIFRVTTPADGEARRVRPVATFATSVRLVEEQDTGHY